MKLLSKLTTSAVLAAGLLAGSLRATTFDFSYVFDSNPTTVTGTFEGTINGSFIDNVSNFTLSFDGIATTGTVLAFQADLVSAPVISFNAADNNFYLLQFTNYDPNNVDLSLFDSLFGLNNTDGSATALYAQGIFQDNPLAATWTLTAQNVPESTGILSLLGCSLGVLAWLHRRLRATVVAR